MSDLGPHKEFQATSSVRDVKGEFHPIRLPLLRLTYCRAFRVRQSVALAGTHQLPPQPFTYSLKLMKIKGVEGTSEKKRKESKSEEREENDAPEKNETRDNAGTHTQTRRVVDKHTDRQMSANNTSLGFQAP